MTQEVFSTARNISFVADGPLKLKAIIEAVITVSEPRTKFDEGGAISHSREAKTIRFSATVGGMREIATHLTEWADEAEVEAARIRLATRMPKEESS